MAFLLINGIDVPCSVEGVGQKTEQIGESKRAVDGTKRIHRRVLKQSWDFRTPLLDPRQAECFRRLILGEGQSWTFDDLTKGMYSSKGLGPNAGAVGATINALASWKGAAGLRLSATTGTIQFSALPTNNVREWTVMVARNTGSGWSHYIVTNLSQPLNQGWVNGVYGALTSSWLVVDPSGFVKLDAAGTTTDYDELVILPYRIPTDAEATAGAWGSAIYAFYGFGSSGVPYQWNLARLGAHGEALDPYGPKLLAIGAAPLVVAGKLEDMSFVAPSTGGLRELGFTLEEV